LTAQVPVFEKQVEELTLILDKNQKENVKETKRMESAKKEKAGAKAELTKL
jgi:hypothetical protein